MWTWFHRVLLGTLLERFREHGVGIDASTLDLQFGEDSVFQFPAFDNKLRFVGDAHGTLLRPLSDEALAALQADLLRAWPDLVDEMRRFPVPDRLGVTRNELEVRIEGDTLTITFDLIAD